jgi:hypothetical protein
LNIEQGSTIFDFRRRKKIISCAKLHNSLIDIPCS